MWFLQKDGLAKGATLAVWQICDERVRIRFKDGTFQNFQAHGRSKMRLSTI